MKNLKDKVIAITGGATGIGFALAKNLGLEGAKIIIGEPREEKLQESSRSSWRKPIENLKSSLRESLRVSQDEAS